MKTNRLAAMLVVAMATWATAGDVRLGDCRERVVACLGQPQGLIQAGPVLIMGYERGSVELRNNRVTCVNLISPQMAAQRRFAANQRALAARNCAVQQTFGYSPAVVVRQPAVCANTVVAVSPAMRTYYPNTVFTRGARIVNLPSCPVIVAPTYRRAFNTSYPRYHSGITVSVGNGFYAHPHYSGYSGGCSTRGSEAYFVSSAFH